MLGRIDSGFGEKLANIGRGYTDLSQKFDRFSYEPGSAANRADKADAKKAEIEEQEARRQDIIEDLMQRASVAGEEKADLLARLSALSTELEQSKLELEKQRRGIDDEFSSEFKEYLSTFIARHFPGGLMDGPAAIYDRYFAGVLDDPQFKAGAKTYMRKNGLLHGKSLTLDGIALVRSILQNR